MNLYVSYRDELGVVLAQVEGGNISFLCGVAYFTCDGKDYKVKAEDILEIALCD